MSGAGQDSSQQADSALGVSPALQGHLSGDAGRDAGNVQEEKEEDDFINSRKNRRLVITEKEGKTITTDCQAESSKMEPIRCCGKELSCRCLAGFERRRREAGREACEVNRLFCDTVSGTCLLMLDGYKRRSVGINYRK